MNTNQKRLALARKIAARRKASDSPNLPKSPSKPTPITNFFDGAAEYRETMRESYEKHAKLARQSGADFLHASGLYGAMGSMVPETAGINSPHSFGLYGALGCAYEAQGWRAVKMEVLWGELAPFLTMKEAEAIDAIAEYVILRAWPSEARREQMSSLINNALRANYDSPLIGLAVVGIVNRVYWCRLLDPSVRQEIAKIYGISLDSFL